RQSLNGCRPHESRRKKTGIVIVYSIVRGQCRTRRQETTNQTGLTGLTRKIEAGGAQPHFGWKFRPVNFGTGSRTVPGLYHPMLDKEQLTEKIIGCAMAVLRALGPGFLESVYENALAHELQNTLPLMKCRS